MTVIIPRGRLRDGSVLALVNMDGTWINHHHHHHCW